MLFGPSRRVALLIPAAFWLPGFVLPGPLRLLTQGDPWRRPTGDGRGCGSTSKSSHTVRMTSSLCRYFVTRAK
jgi:hypothetical protein